MKGVFFIAGESETNKSEISEIAFDKMEEKGKKVGYFKPVGNEPDALYSLQIDPISRKKKPFFQHRIFYWG